MNNLELVDIFNNEIVIGYSKDMKNLNGSITLNLLNKLNTKFEMILVFTNLTKEQKVSFNKIRNGFLEVQSQIDSDRLDFNWLLNEDKELCFNKESENGVSSLIFNEDGTLSYWFIAFKNSIHKSIRNFYYPSDINDSEKIVFNFLSY
ncbi:MAG: hypothetical protein EAZ27_10500 [Cytophagales bacterium]|nr:MAG: hypothetical protein EAZ27_10500 [Cytophagales bacterium]